MLMLISFDHHLICIHRSAKNLLRSFFDLYDAFVIDSILDLIFNFS